jgi:hypothetical protein
MARVESRFQARLIKELYQLFPGCIILKNDPEYIDDIPDLLILFGDRWAALECKSAAEAARQPNQEWYVEKMNEMSFAAFIFPGNKERVLDGLQLALRPRRKARISERV